MIVDKIIEAMKIRKVKSIDLANHIGVTKSTMSLFINKKSKLGQDKIEAIFDYLGIILTITD